VNHVQLVRQARGAEMPESFWTDPLMYQGGSDSMLAPRDPIPLADESWGCDLEAEVVVITGDIAQGASREACLEAVRLVALVNDVSLRNLIPAELAKGFGFVQSKPASALSPGRGHARGAGRRLAGRQAAPAAAGRAERGGVRAGRTPAWT
jgi:fumarylacetoacetate (FAA) hydrolase